MQATADVAQNHVGRRGFHGHVSRRIARLFERRGGRTPTLLPALLICLLVASGQGVSVAQMSHAAAAAPAQTDAQKAFERLKTLAGSWQGSGMGIGAVNLTIRATSTGHAVLHEVTGAGRPDDPITMFYVEGERLLLTHYCDAGNRPRMEGKLSPDGKTIDFSFVDISGGTQRGYMSRAVFNIVDADRHTEGWAYVLPDGRQVQTPVVEFTRKK